MMTRVDEYQTRRGAIFPNTTRLRIPFTLMDTKGDWCLVREDKKTIAGNVASLCSMHGKKLNRQFTFKDQGNGFYRITFTGKPWRYRQT